MSKPFPYVFPQMPPRFRRCCAFAKAVFLIQWGCFAVSCFGSVVMFFPVIIFGRETELSAMTDSNPLLALLALVVTASLLLFFLAVPFGFTPRLFWHCPCCRYLFPYRVPTRGDNLRGKECMRAIEGRHIKYAKLTFCPLIIPSVCPECKAKFFDMADDGQIKGHG